MGLNRVQKYYRDISQNETISNSDFRLLFLEVRNNPFLGDLMFDFADLTDETKEGPYSSIIIGPNGTGKSNILRALIQIFRELNEIIKTGKRINEIQGQFQLIYLKNGRIIKFGNIAGVANEDLNISPKIYSSEMVEVFEIIDQEKIKIQPSVEIARQEHLPNAIAASSIMLTDKFPVIKEKDDFSIYNYLGVRRTPSIAGTRTYVRRTVDHLVDKIDDPEFINNLFGLMDFLDLKKSLTIQYHPRYRKLLFNGQLTREILFSFFDRKEPLIKRKTEPRGLPYFERILNDNEKIDSIIRFCNTLSYDLELERKKSVEYDIINDQSLKGDYSLLKDLQALDFISYPTILLKRVNSDYNLEESSSGEYHLLSTLIGVLATIKEGSLVLIDEPEISLHPNWQMKFMYYIRQIFERYKSCHFIIATHSHFLVSDLKDESSCVVALSRDLKNKIIAETLKFDTYARSAEQILLNVFKVPTTRNFYVSDKVGEILELISKETRDDNLIAEKVQELRDHNLDKLSNEDPLKDVVVKLMERYR